MIRVVSDGLTIDAARRDILKIVKPIVEEINQNTLIRKYLHTYPFRPDSVYAGVRYLNSSGWFIPTDKVNDVTLMDGRIYYQTYYAQRKLGDQFVGIHSETYQEALEKVNDE